MNKFNRYTIFILLVLAIFVVSGCKGIVGGADDNSECDPCSGWEMMRGLEVEKEWEHSHYEIEIEGRIKNGGPSCAKGRDVEIMVEFYKNDSYKDTDKVAETISVMKGKAPIGRFKYERNRYDNLYDDIQYYLLYIKVSGCPDNIELSRGKVKIDH